MNCLFAAVLASSPAFAIDSVDVFTGSERLENQTVVVRDGRIEAVSPWVSQTGTASAELERIDGRGMTLLPGLIDAHAHTFGSALSDAVRFGVTTVLDMFTTEDFARTERAKRATFADVAQADLFSSVILATSEGGHGTEYGIAIPTVGAASISSPAPSACKSMSDRSSAAKC